MQKYTINVILELLQKLKLKYQGQEGLENELIALEVLVKSLQENPESNKMKDLSESLPSWIRK